MCLCSAYIVIAQFHYPLQKQYDNTTRLLVKTKPTKAKMSKKGLNTLRNNNNIYVLPDDKGNANVIVDKNTKINALLDDATTYMEKTTKQKIKRTNLDEETQVKVIPPKKYSICPIWLMVHKPGAPLRPIVSPIGLQTQQLAIH